MKRFLVCSLFLAGTISLVAAGNLVGQVPNGADNIHVFVKGRPWETDGDAVSVPSTFATGRISSHRHTATINLPGVDEKLRTANSAAIRRIRTHPYPAWLRIYRYIITIRCFR